MEHDNSLVQGSERKLYRFVFTGKGGEYFSIWIVNLLLSIVTLGIYSAWAKVRREQYFHRNTLLDDHPFDYTGDPVRILLGRIIALVVIGGGSLLQEVNVALALGVTVFFMIAFPWVMVRSLRFRARNTRYRNLAFRFTGTTGQAARAYFWIYVALLPVLLAGVLMGNDLQKFQANPQAVDPATAMQVAWGMGAAMAATVLLFVALWPAYQCHIKAFLHRNIRYGNAQGGFEATAGEFYAAVFRAFGTGLLTIIIIGAIAAIAMRLHMPWLLIAIYPALFLPQAAYTVNLTNLTYQRASLGEQRFVSDMAIAPYAWLMFTNLLLLLFTLGLAWPWIAVRLARYRLEHMAVSMADGAVDRILGEAQGNESAFGEEAAEFLDFDISL